MKVRLAHSPRLHKKAIGAAAPRHISYIHVLPLKVVDASKSRSSYTKSSGGKLKKIVFLPSCVVARGTSAKGRKKKIKSNSGRRRRRRCVPHSLVLARFRSSSPPLRFRTTRLWPSTDGQSDVGSRRPLSLSVCPREAGFQTSLRRPLAARRPVDFGCEA